MVITYVLFVVGLFLLIKSADWIVDSAASLADKFRVSSLIIGLTVVALGTSLPEFVVNLFAVFSGSSEIIFGNIIGSNISNILLILGITAMIGEIKIGHDTVWGQIPFALLASFVLFVLTSDIFNKTGILTRSNGLILLSLFAVFIYYIFQMARKNKKELEVETVVDKSAWKIGIKLIIGLIGIYFAGMWVIDGVSVIGSELGLSQYLISATVIALGTSLPELVVSVMAVRKQNVDLAVGNIVGSNIFNIFWVLGIMPVISPLRIPPFIGLDIAIMFLSTLLLFIFMFTGKEHKLNKKEGFVFVLFYVLYVVFVVYRG